MSHFFLRVISNRINQIKNIKILNQLGFKIAVAHNKQEIAEKRTYPFTYWNGMRPLSWLKLV